MGGLKFSLTQYKDPRTVDSINNSNHTVLAVWALDCTHRVIHFFENEHPHDSRPQQALDTLLLWIRTGDFSMSVIRKASLGSHAAAKDIGNNSPAASAAHSAGQAVATAHVPLHALGAANYALQAVYRASLSSEAARLVTKEHQWQLQHLRDLSINLK